MNKILMFPLLASLAGCDDGMVCVRSHEETYTYMQQLFTGMVNNIPQYTYIPAVGTQFVCDEERPKDAKVNP